MHFFVCLFRNINYSSFQSSGLITTAIASVIDRITLNINKIISVLHMLCMLKMILPKMKYAQQDGYKISMIKLHKSPPLPLSARLVCSLNHIEVANKLNECITWSV